MADVSTLAQGNVIAGAGKLYIGATGNRRIVGHTQGGVSQQLIQETFQVESDQDLAIIRRVLQLQRMEVKTTLLEMQLKNLQEAWNQPVGNLDTASNILTVGVGVIAELVLLVLGPGVVSGGNTSSRSGEYPRAVSMDSGAFSYSRTEAQIVEVTFDCLFDDTTSKFATLRDFTGGGAEIWVIGRTPGDLGL